MNRLGVFAKYWQAGTVKTRLAAAIGHENAASLYRVFMTQTLTRQNSNGDARTVWIWPPERQSEFSHFIDQNRPLAWSVRTQSDGDLGCKMRNFFQESLADATHEIENESEQQPNANEKSCDTTQHKVVLIGTDSPDLPESIIQQAFAELDQHQCVLGPSRDGGYYLIGMNQLITDIFEDVAWSSTEVLTQTLQKLEQLSISTSLLPEWNDIDEWDDLVEMKNWLADKSDPSDSDKNLLAAIDKFGIRI